jgi:transcriptional regulator with PAS, ATPase and Fis domain
VSPAIRRDLKPRLIGISRPMTALVEEVERVARSDAKVLITGESGVGKEVLAQELCARSRRASRPYVAVNCGGLPETLLESELFGHVRGSFTGAYRDKPGKLELANTGTVFLDEISEMTLRMQGLLLRFLETGEIQKVGADATEGRMDVRVIAATNRDPREMIEQGLFREDLYYRLNVIRLTVPPLRERKQDIPLLIDHFLSRFASHNGRAHTYSIAPDAMTALTNYKWPGNVRQLQNTMERMVVVDRSEVITLEDLPAEIRTPQRPGKPLIERRRTVADDLYARMTKEQESFWTAVYPLYMRREITRDAVREIVRRGLEDARGSYRVVARMFNMAPDDYKRFLNFLRKHHCQLPYKQFR